ncbi:MAG: membrane protein [Mycobacterium sp.]
MITRPDGTVREMLNKVPEVTIYFWIIKILATTVGETVADFLNIKLNFWLTGTTYVMGALLAITLGYQFRTRQYVPGLYWLTVVLISVSGTLITDNLVDNFGVPLQTTTIIFSIALAATFTGWYASEKTLSIHTINCSRRESFYWLTILFTFALGTAAGDLVAERLHLGYPLSALAFGALIAVIAVAHLGFRLNAVLAFWAAYILTRPLGASVGDLLSQPRSNGGLGLGTTWTSVLFLLTIIALVTYLTITRKDVLALPIPNPADELAHTPDTPRGLGSTSTAGARNAPPAAHPVPAQTPATMPDPPGGGS